MGLSKEAENWALYNFAGQDAKIKSVYRSLSMCIALFIKINRYKIKPETLDGLIQSAVLEFTQPVCLVCNGTGYIVTKEKQGECGKCKGRGRAQISKRERCLVIGINHKSYSDTHDTITKELIRLIGSWEEEIIRNVNQKMGDAA